MGTIADSATIKLVVNGEEAQANLKKLKNDLAAARAEVIRLQQAGSDSKSIKSAQKNVSKLEKDLERTQSRAENVKKALEGMDNMSLRQLKQSLKTVMGQLQGVQKGSKEWDAHVNAVRILKERIAELNDELSVNPTLWQRIKTGANDVWPVFDMISRGFSFVVGSLRGYVEDYAAMDQEMANVRKFTGLTEEQVAALNEEFKNIDTRTSREDLNKLAQEAGRLGKTSTEDVLGFVRAADQINVALDDLGEGATLTLSKLTGIFGDEARYGTEQSLLKVGSVINELSQNCSASAPYLAEFASRMGGVGAQANMTIPQIMGFGAVLDSNGQKVEASATALSQVIVRLYQDPAKYAKVAGLDAKKFADLMRQDANAALIMFLETLQKSGGMDRLSPMFKDMGETGARAIAALSTLATNINQVKEQQEAANVAFEEGTSVTGEFNVQNNTVQAGLDKAKKKFHELRVELGEKLSPIMTHVISLTSVMARVLLNAVNFASQNKAAIIGLAAAIGVYTVAIKAELVVNKLRLAMKTSLHALTLAKAKATALLSTAVNAAKFAYYSYTGQLRKAVVAQKALNTAMKASPWGLLIAGATAAIGLFVNYKNKAKEAAKAQQELIEKQRQEAEELRKQREELRTVRSDFEKNAENEIKNIKKLVETAADENKTRKDRLDAVKQLQSIYPDYFGNLTTEEILAGKTKTAYDNLTTSILKAARARAGADKFVELEAQEYDIDKRLEANTAQVSSLQESADTAKNKLYDQIREFITEENKNHNPNPQGRPNPDLTDSQAFSKILGDVQNMTSRPEDGTWGAEMYDAYQEYYTSTQLLTAALKEQTALKNSKIENILAQGDIKEQYKLTDEDIDASRTTNTNPIITPPPIDPDKKPERFAVENNWRAMQEALAMINKYRGFKIDESGQRADYSAYDFTKEMDQILVDFYDKILERNDLSSQETLDYTSKRLEALAKQSRNSGAHSVDEENLINKENVAKINQDYVDGIIDLKEKNQQIEDEELRHLGALRDIYDKAREVQKTDDGAEFVDPEALANYNKAAEAYTKAAMAVATRVRENADKEKSDKESERQKVKSQYFGDNASERKAKYDAEIALLDEVKAAELAAAGDSVDEKLRIEEAYQIARLAIAKKYQQNETEEQKNVFLKVNDWLNSDGGNALTGTLSTLSSGMSNIFSQVTASMQADLERQTAAINSRYDAEISMAEGNSYKVKKLEEQREKEIAKVKAEANRKQFAMQVIQAVAQTSQNAIAAYGSAAAIPIVGPALAPIAASMAIAAGMLQIAAIKKQQQAAAAQGYSKGGFTRKGRVDEPAGIVHAGEWVASQRLLANPVARPMIEALDYAQRTNTIGTLRAEDVSRSITANDSLVRIAESDNGSLVMAAVASKMSTAVSNLTDRLNEPFVTINTVTGDHGINKAQAEYDKLMRNKTPNSKK